MNIFIFMIESKGFLYQIPIDCNVLKIGFGTVLLTKFFKIQMLMFMLLRHLTSLNEHYKKINSKNINFNLGNAYDLNFEDKSFDSGMRKSILHHVNLKKL